MSRMTGPAGDGRCRAGIPGLPVDLHCDGEPRGRVDICLRAENLAIVGEREPAVRARVAAVTYRGAAHSVDLTPLSAPEIPLRLRHPGPPPQFGDTVALTIRSGWVLPQRRPTPKSAA